MRIAAVGDLHCGRGMEGGLHGHFSGLAEHADVLLLCGDLTDYGLPEEARSLAHELAGVSSLPVLAVLGNHDHEQGQAAEVVHVLREAGVHVLEGQSCVIQGVGFAGTKGFIGGFGTHTLGAWGERATKALVEESIRETMLLEAALARLRTEHKIVLLHYAPVSGTCTGEPPEIVPFLGCSRLEEPINRFGASAVFHGHVHRGSLRSHTYTGIPVFNVSLPLLDRQGQLIAGAFVIDTNDLTHRLSEDLRSQ